MVVSRKPALLQTAATWIRRLDRADSERTSVHVYRVRYGDARQIARVLSDMFVGSVLVLDRQCGKPARAGIRRRSSLGRRPVVVQHESVEFIVIRQPVQPARRKRVWRDVPAGDAAARRPSASGGGGSTPRGGSGGGQPIMPNVRITPDPVNNTLLIYADRENYRIISSTLQQLDQPELQVAIDATIAEVTLNNQLTYGVQFFLSSKNLGLGHRLGSRRRAIDTAPTASPPPRCSASSTASFPGSTS